MSTVPVTPRADEALTLLAGSLRNTLASMKIFPPLPLKAFATIRLPLATMNGEVKVRLPASPPPPRTLVMTSLSIS